MTVPVLLVNDDGGQSLGLRAMRTELRRRGFAVTTVAPDGNRSGASVSVTCRGSVRLRRVGGSRAEPIYDCTGTPADCVRVGLLADLGPAPGIVVSGINHGINLGDDVTYSGTASAAVEAALLGCIGIAISQQGRDGGVPVRESGPHDFDLAPVAARLVEAVLADPPPPRVAINVNFPARPVPGESMRVTRRGWRRYRRGWIELEPDGARELVCQPFGSDEAPGPAWEDAPDTDFRAVLDGYVSLTPLMLDAVAPEQAAATLAWARSLCQALGPVLDLDESSAVVAAHGGGSDEQAI